MGYIVVQWKNENSVSVVNEKQVVGAVVLKEGRTVNVSAGTTKGRVAVYEATVLKVCATKSQALEFEKSLLTPAAVETKGDEKRKRPRKPSQKVKENFEGDLGKDQEEDVDNDKDQISQKKRRMNKKGKDADKEEEKRRETDKKKLQKSVQEERVAKILHGLRKPELVETSDSEESAMHHAVIAPTKTTTPDNYSIAKHSTITSQSQTTPLVNHSSSTNIISRSYSPTQTTPLLKHSSRTHSITSHTHSPTQTTPLLNHSSHRQTITSHTYSPTHNTPLLNHSSRTQTITSHTYSPTQNALAFNHSTGRHTNTSHKRTPLTDHNSHKTLQNAPITPRQVLDLDTYETPLSHHMSPSFTELLNLVDDECENVPLVDSPAPPKTIGNSNWESFASHFTQEFEWLKAEVDGLRNEVKNLRRTVRELKANSSSVHGNAGLSASQPQQTEENQLLEMVKNTTKPLEGLKTILYELFTPDEVRQSSLKGRTTVTGGESIGLQRQKLDLVYCVMESRYKMDRLPVDNLIRGQQRKLRAQQKKTNSS